MALSGCTELAKRDFDVTLFASAGSLTAERARNEGIRTITVDTSQRIDEVVKQVSEEFARGRPHFFISYHSMDRKVGRALRKRFGKTFLNIADRQNQSQSIPVVGSLLYNIYFDYLIACSDGVASSLSSSGIFRRKIHTIHNAIAIPADIDTIDGNGIRKEWHIDDHIVLGVSAWFHKKRKGFDVLFQAVSKLDDRFSLLIVGIPPSDHGSVVAYAAEFGVPKERIILPGFVENVWSYYKAMDFFLLPSRSEGFSLALLEAAAARVPSIASNIPGTNEFIRHEHTGLLFDVKEPPQLSKAIERLSCDHRLASSCAERAQEEVYARYTLEQYGNKLVTFLDSISPRQT